MQRRPSPARVENRRPRLISGRFRSRAACGRGRSACCAPRPIASASPPSERALPRPPNGSRAITCGAASRAEIRCRHHGSASSSCGIGSTPTVAPAPRRRRGSPGLPSRRSASACGCRNDRARCPRNPALRAGRRPRPRNGPCMPGRRGEQLAPDPHRLAARQRAADCARPGGAGSPPRAPADAARRRRCCCLWAATRETISHALDQQIVQPVVDLVDAAAQIFEIGRGV